MTENKMKTFEEAEKEYIEKLANSLNGIKILCDVSGLVVGKNECIFMCGTDLYAKLRQYSLDIKE